MLLGEAGDTERGVDLPGADELLASEDIPASKDILASMQTIARSLHTNTNTLGDLPTPSTGPWISTAFSVGIQSDYNPMAFIVNLSLVLFLRINCHITKGR